MMKHILKNQILIASFLSLLFQTDTFSQGFKPSQMKELLYGVAYYHEYMPEDRLDKDIALMKECGINVVRMCESSWGIIEPQDGVFDFSWIDRELNAFQKAGIHVIIGTPTYAIPTWMAKAHPEILAVTRNGRSIYGTRQNMDITNPAYRFYSERVIRRLVDHVKDHPAVIGYQLDNETKSYGTAGDNVQIAFTKYLKNKFHTVENLNKAFGLNYWSNNVNTWEDFPSAMGTINGSLGAEFSRFQRKLVSDFLAWQASIVNEYKRPGQFTTQNFDLDWRNGSYAWQTEVDHFEAAHAVDIAGIDIYHPTADRLNGVVISLGGDVARSLKQDNYLVMETQAQSILNSATQELPYPGQLRLQAFSHFASGANMVEYWPWHSIHNGAETYWKGLLSHDMEPNPTFMEAKQIAAECKKIGSHLIDLNKENQVAILVSNESITSLQWFGINNQLNYNDVLRQIYEELYFMNIPCDFICPSSKNKEKYKLIIAPPLYTASDSLLMSLNDYVIKGGHMVYAFKSGFCNENTQVRTQRMPALLRDACGFTYQQFINIEKMALKDDPYKVGKENNYVSDWAELLVPEKAKVIAWYDHPYYGKYAAITHNTFGKGTVTYFGAMPARPILKNILADAVKEAGLWGKDQSISFPLITKQGKNRTGKQIHYYMNYSGESKILKYPYLNGIDLLTGQPIATDGTLELKPWDLAIIEEL
jgi:beta-galactosidase